MKNEILGHEFFNQIFFLRKTKLYGCLIQLLWLGECLASFLDNSKVRNLSPKLSDLKIDLNRIRLLIKSCCNRTHYNQLLNSVVILQPLWPIDDHKDESNNRFNAPGEVDTPLQNLTLPCRISGIFQVKFFPSIVLFLLIDMYQIIVVSLEVLEDEQ